MIYIYPYSRFSESARLIANNSEGRIKLFRPAKHFPSGFDSIIRWGNVPVVNGTNKVINKNNSIVINKSIFFNHCKEYDWCPKFSHSFNEDVKKWLTDGSKVVCRKKVSSSGGDGIFILKPSDNLDSEGIKKNIQESKLFVKYIPKELEFRVHVCGGKVIKVQRKIMKKGQQPKEGWEVRSYDNGFRFQSVDPSSIPEECLAVATKAVHHCGLDFGGCDVIYNKASDRAYVLEVNSAPGIEGDTVKAYIDALVQLTECI